MDVGGRSLAIALTLVLVAACSSRPPAPIEDHSRPGSSSNVQSYRVLRGDTLYSIAFRYGLDYRRLAAANDIAVPYTIYVGQKLRLAEADVPPPAKPVPRGTAAASRTAPATPQPKKSPATVARTAPAATVAADERENRVVSQWRWPSAGKLTRRFDGARHKGVDISGQRGDPISATAAGQVVYAGSGIVGYGLVLIVRHNDEYLSAYGHTDGVLVDEGDKVQAGQEIARMGSSGTDSVKLHFELRRQGRPVDPLKLLPSR